MISKCKFCGKEFNNISHNRVLCYDNHYIKCIECNKDILLNSRKLREFNTKGYLCCSKQCGDKYSSKLKILKRDKDLDLDLLQYYVESTAVSFIDIAKIFNTSIDYILDRVKRYDLVRPTYLTEESKKSKGKKISASLKNIYSNQELKVEIENKKRNTYFNKTGYHHNFQNPECIAQSKQTRYIKYNKYQSPKFDEYMQNRTKEEMSKIGKKASQTTFERYGYRGKIVKYMENETEEQKLKRIASSKETWKNKSIEEKQQIANKVKITKSIKYNDPHYNNLEKRKKTNLERYNVENPFQSKELMKNAYNKKYGVDYPSQIHLSDRTLNIIANEQNYRDYIQSLSVESRNVSFVTSDLGISYSHFYVLRHSYNCEDLIKLNNISNIENDIIQLLKHLNIEYKVHNHDIISPLELDFYIPCKNLALECNGTFWHSTAIRENKNYHYNKSKLCEEKGIRLIHIWEYEWYNERQRPILENIIKNALGINEHKLYARKLDIEVRSSNIMKEFFEKNHIQGFRGGKFAICLIDKSQGEFDILGNYRLNTGKVYMAYMMGKAFFGKGKYEWEVIRGATELGYTIIGGASKIFNYFIKNYNPKNCVYYIDYNYFNGNSLKNLPKMEFIKTQPSFKDYFKNQHTVKNRNPMHYKEIVEGYKDGSILQIWNAGTKVYVWNNTKDIEN